MTQVNFITPASAVLQYWAMKANLGVLHTMCHLACREVQNLVSFLYPSRS